MSEQINPQPVDEVLEEVEVLDDVDSTETPEPEVEETPVEDGEEVAKAPEVKINVTVTYDPRKPIPETNKDKPLGLLSLTGEGMTDFVTDQKFKANADTLNEKYIDAIRDGMQFVFSDNVIERAIENGVDLGQFVDYEEKRLQSGVPVYNSRSGDVLTGIKAVSQMQRALGQGSFLNFPCWASGVWLTLRAPTTFELADYYDAVSEEIIELGKQTGGATHNTSSVYLAKYLIDLVEKLVHKSTIKGYAGSDVSLRDVLVVDDLQTIAWALGVCMYPNGYPFEEPCTVDIEKCTEVYSTLINISKMYYVDRSRLTNWQVEFMSNKTHERSLDEIKKYQLEANWLRSEAIDYPGFKILIKTPTVGEYIDAGYRWIANIEQSIRNTLTDIGNSRLNTLMMERAGLTLLRGYSHYVKSFIYDNGSVVNSKKDIDEVINSLCSSPDIVAKFTDDVKDHISKSAISMIAMPRHNCPNCGKDSHLEDTAHPYLIPIDGLQLFFALRDQKIQLN